MEKKSLYSIFIDMKTEIDRHKWFESEKNHHDVGFEYALTDWVQKHRLDFINNLNCEPNEKIK